MTDLAAGPTETTNDARRCVEGFLADVRSGRFPDRAEQFMAPLVRAHQIESEQPRSLTRTPGEYADHVREMLSDWGPFELQVQQLLADGDLVYARWEQRGWLQSGPGRGAEIVQAASAVYRVRDGVILEYWIQIDRHGLAEQVAAARAGS